MLVLVSGCELVADEGHQLALLDVPESFDPIPVPSHNPTTRAKVELGERLFSDVRLSEDGSVSCASCHLPERAFADPRPLSIGVHGRTGIRNSPTLVNIAYQNLLFWDGGAFTLESQALGPLENPVEMDMNLGALLDRISSDASYQAAFEDVFGQEVNVLTLTQALGAFQRTIRSGGAPIDRYLSGQEDALSASARRGMILFENKADCASCHSGFLFTDQTYQNNGLTFAAADSGRARITLNSDDFAKFRVPTLRNVGISAPFMHDGRFFSLEEVINHYDRGGTNSRGQSGLVRSLQLSDMEKADLKAFLLSLSDDCILSGLPDA